MNPFAESASTSSLTSMPAPAISVPTKSDRSAAKSVTATGGAVVSVGTTDRLPAVRGPATGRRADLGDRELNQCCAGASRHQHRVARLRVHLVHCGAIRRRGELRRRDVPRLGGRGGGRDQHGERHRECGSDHECRCAQLSYVTQNVLSSFELLRDVYSVTSRWSIALLARWFRSGRMRYRLVPPLELDAASLPFMRGYPAGRRPAVALSEPGVPFPRTSPPAGRPAHRE